MNSPGNDPSTDSREKWIAIDRLCDAYEASLQDGTVERAPFLAGVPPEWREQLSSEFDAIEASYRDAQETTEEVPERAKQSRRADSTELDWSDNPRRLPNIVNLSALVDSKSKTAWLGRFEVKERLGSGATGSVWRARDDRLDRWVALKVPHATRVMSDTTAARFKTEARAAAAISHPNVVQVHEVLIEDGLPILIQQWIDGPSMAKALKKSGPMDCDRAADWMIQIADAVACAHEHGIVHRDLKPANVMLSGGRPMVLDFGLASYPEFSSGLTTEGTMLGTPAYMSPEQAQGKDSSEPTADIYSLGAMLYEMLVGTPPFVGKTSDVLESVKHAMPVAPRNHRSSIPRDLQTITLRCLAKSPKARYASAGELRDDLRRFRERKPIRARKVSLVEQSVVWFRARPVATTLWVLLPLLVLFGAGYALSRVQQRELSDRADDLAQQQRADSFRNQLLREQHKLLKLSRASQELTRGDRRRGQQLLQDISKEQRGWEWRLLDSTVNTPAVTIRRGERDPSKPPAMSLVSITGSPDGESFYASSDDGRIFKGSLVPDKTFGTLTQLYAGRVRVNAIAVSPSGKILAWTDEYGAIVTWDLVNQKRVERRDRGRNRQPGYALAFSKDGRWLAVGGGRAPNSQNPQNKRCWLETYNVSPGGKLSKSRGLATDEQTQVGSLQFLPSGILLVARGGPGVRTEEPGAVETWRVGPKQLERIGRLWGGLNARGLDFDPKRRRIAWCDALGVFYIYDLNERRIVCRRRASAKTLHEVRFSVDGTELYCVGDEPDVSAWALKTVVRKVGDTQENQKQVEAIPLDQFRGHLATVRDAIVLPNFGETSEGQDGDGHPPLHGLVTASADGSIRAWLDSDQGEIERLDLGRHLTGARWVDDATLAVTSYANAEEENVLHLESKFERNEVVVDQRHLRFAGAVMDGGYQGRYLACCKDRLALFDIAVNQTNETLSIGFDDSKSISTAVAFDSETFVVAACSNRKNQWGGRLANLHVLRAGRSRPLQTYELGDVRLISVMTLSPDGKRLVAGTVTGALVMFPTESLLNGTLEPSDQVQWKAHERRVNAMTWIGDSNQLATVSDDGSLSIWSLEATQMDGLSGRVKLQSKRSIHGSQPLTRVESSTAGDRLLTVGGDHVIRVWDAVTVTQLVSLPPRRREVHSLGLSPNGDYLMVAELTSIDLIRLTEREHADAQDTSDGQVVVAGNGSRKEEGDGE